MRSAARPSPPAGPHRGPPEKQPPRSLRLLLLGGFALWLIGTLGLGWLMLVYPVSLPDAPNRDLPIELAPGSDLEALAERLVQEKVITRPRAFVLYARLLGADRRLRSGPLVVNRALPVRDLLPRLAFGYGPARIRVPIPEGFTRFDVATRLARYGICGAADFERAGRDPELLRKLEIPGVSVEGYLFPATYVLGLDSPPEGVLREMVRVFRERTRDALARYEQQRDAAPWAFSPHEIITLASIVEREARAPEERPTIAGVFVNRLTSPDFRPKRLQADPTVAYGCLVAREQVPSCAEFDGRRITPAMVRDPANPYSTYRHEGLPPGPICNPGLSSLEAALHPEPHQFFYFVTSGAGRHAFSRTLDEHNARVRGAPSRPPP